MKKLRRWFKVLALVCACAVLTHARVLAEEKASDTSSDAATKCTEFLKKVIAAKRKELDKRMADEIAEVAKITGLAPDGVKSLEIAAATAEDAAQAELLAKALELYLKAYARMGGRGLQQLDQPGVVETMARSDSGFDSALHYTRALDQPAWTDALARVLTPEQAAAWQKAQAAKVGKVPKEFEDMLDQQAEQVRITLSSPMFTKSTEIIDTLELSGERADAVTSLAKKAIDASLNAWRADARKQYLSNDGTARTRMARGMPFSFTPQDEDAPDNQPVWTQGIAKLLSDGDRAKLESSHGLQRKRRTHAMAMLMLALLDDKVAFTTSQRPKLEPIMQRLVQNVEELYPPADNNSDYFNLSPSVFYKAAAAAKAEELQPILDDIQWKRWQTVCRDKDAPNEEEEEMLPPPATPAKKEADAVEEPEDLERFVSDYLVARITAQRKEMDAAMLLQAEDATRVASLPPDTAARLRTAAHGAAEMALVTWSTSLEQTVRSQAQGADKENLQQRLSNMNRYYVGQATPKDQNLWKQAIKTDLTKAQQDAWQVERDARAQYTYDAVAQFLLAEFDRSFVLNPEQWEKLAPVVAKTIQDYRPDIERMYSYNSARWYLMSYSMFLPVHAIPEEDCKAILGKEKYEHWTASNNYRYSVQYWTNLKQYHEQRTKEEKK